MPLFSDSTADMTHKTRCGQTGACMVTVCRLFSSVALIYEKSDVQDVFVCPCHNCALHLKLKYLRVGSYVPAHYEQTSECTVCVCDWCWQHGGMRGVRPECMAWFSQHADES